MALTEGWKRRLDRWQKAITGSVYSPLSPVDLLGFTTLEQLTLEQAQAHVFRPMPPGTPWGAKWEYGWFKTQLVLPEAAQGKRIVFAIDENVLELNGHFAVEGLVWVNGREVGALDFGHKEVTLTLNGQPGDQFDVLMEVYAGHGVRNEGGGPLNFRCCQKGQSPGRN